MTVNSVILDSLKITSALRIHLNEKDCKHSIKEIVKGALGHTDLAPDSKITVTTFTSSKNGDSIVV